MHGKETKKKNCRNKKIPCPNSSSEIAKMWRRVGVYGNYEREACGCNEEYVNLQVLTASY